MGNQLTLIPLTYWAYFKAIENVKENKDQLMLTTIPESVGVSVCVCVQYNDKW